MLAREGVRPSRGHRRGNARQPGLHSSPRSACAWRVKSWLRRAPTLTLITREPIGVVGVITPWNFPIALPSWKIAAALAYGNCVIFKPVELTLGSAFMLTEMLDRTGVPRGVFNLTMGGGSTVGPALLDSDEVDAITFTGSTETGRRIRGAAAHTGKKVQLEMGGKNPTRCRTWGQRRLLFNRPATHCIVSPHRDGRHL